MSERVASQPLLRHLARLGGVETSYEDADGVRRLADPEVIRPVLAALGVAPSEEFDDVRGVLDALLLRHWRRSLPPIIVVWDGAPVRVGLRLPAVLAEAPVEGCLKAADAPGASFAQQQITWSADASPCTARAHVAGHPFVRRFITLSPGLARGYFELEIEVGGMRSCAHVLSAPRRAEASSHERTWGAFAPCYALRSSRDWGAGDIAELGELARWVGSLGGSFVGTLPLLALHPVELGSPYRPLSRLFWNEALIDIESAPEFANCAEARELMASEEFRADLARARATSLVDAAGVRERKRHVLDLLLRALHEREDQRLGAFRSWVRAHQELTRFARFCVSLEPNGARGPRSKSPARRKSRVDPLERVQYAQWLAHQQLEALAQRSPDVSLFLDLPLGVHPDGYDAWSRPHLFVNSLSTGAPPDAFCRGGQDWGVPPLHPSALRRDGYAYFRDCVRHHLSVAKLLRIDHVMGFHHLYVVPRGIDAAHGLYIRYRPEEFYAVLQIEAERAAATIVGEDLGAVPGSVRKALEREGIERLYVFPFELAAERDEHPKAAPANSLASLGTHDTPTFAGYWSDNEPSESGGNLERMRLREAWLRELRRLELLTTGSDATLHEILDASLRWLAEGPARHVLVSLEDLWLEALPQNVPGTGDSERPNWRRKFARTLEELKRDASIRARLEHVAATRPGRGQRTTVVAAGKLR
jgi:4-alpha-glucanotransferase